MYCFYNCKRCNVFIVESPRNPKKILKGALKINCRGQCCGEHTPNMLKAMQLTPQDCKNCFEIHKTQLQSFCPEIISQFKFWYISYLSVHVNI